MRLICRPLTIALLVLLAVSQIGCKSDPTSQPPLSNGGSSIAKADAKDPLSSDPSNELPSPPAVGSLTADITAYGAIGDGRQLDTAAVQKALNACRDAGGVVEDLSYRNLTMTNVKVPILITSYYPTIPRVPEDDPKQAAGRSTPIWRHIHIENVTATGAAQAGRIIGLPEQPISDIQLDHVSLSAKTGLQIVNADWIQFADSSVTATSGPDLIVHKSQIAGIDERTGRPSTLPSGN